MAVGLMQDLTLILSTKKHQTKSQKKTPKKTKPKQEFIFCKRRGEGFIVKNTCCALLPAKTSWKMPIVKKICCVLLQAELHDLDMLCFAASLIVKKIQLCTLVHLLCTFSNVFIKWNDSGANSRAGRVYMSGTC